MYNLIDEKTWKYLKLYNVVVKNQRVKTNKIFKAYGGNLLSILGLFETKLVIGSKSIDADFYVVKEDGKFLIGRETGTSLGILKITIDVNEIIEEKKEKAFGKIKGVVVDIPIKRDARPIAQAYRRVPIALEEKVNQKIDKLLAQGIIEKVNEPSKWISPI